MLFGSIQGFEGRYKFLSNFYPCEVHLDGIKYPSVEHAYQAAKTLDSYQRKQILQAANPGYAKRLGRTVVLRPDWEEIKTKVMLDLVLEKFSVDPFKTWILGTGDMYLEETNWWNDTFWGVCNGVGKNNLGKILMHVRTMIRISERNVTF